MKKDDNNLIGISIGGGAPLCPCIYVVQVFDNTPAAKEGTLQSGDEIVAVSGKSTKSKTKVAIYLRYIALLGPLRSHTGQPSGLNKQNTAE